MCSNKELLFTQVKLGSLTVDNRFMRSATYEGMADSDGIVSQKLADLYKRLSAGGVGAIATGFCYVSRQGRAMQRYQAGIASEGHCTAWQKVISEVKREYPEVKMIMQIAHTGRQTLSSVSNCGVVGAGSKRCSYFRQKVRMLADAEISAIIDDFARAASRAKIAGFDGIQVHAAHGYLIHQFLSPYTNNRNDRWGKRSLLLCEILRKIKERCDESYPVLVKLSHSDDRGLRVSDTIQTVKQLEGLADAVEISYGTMEYAMNIFRGGCPVGKVFEVNPLFNKMPGIIRAVWRRFRLKSYLQHFIPFSENYNLAAAREISESTSMPVFAVGGIRSLESIQKIVNDFKLPIISMCRPFICEPDIVSKIAENNWKKSKCTNCNLCAVNCDSKSMLQCYCQ